MIAVILTCDWFLHCVLHRTVVRVCVALGAGGTCGCRSQWDGCIIVVIFRCHVRRYKLCDAAKCIVMACKICRAKQYWEVLCTSFLCLAKQCWEVFCASFVEQSSIGKYLGQVLSYKIVLGSTLQKFCNTGSILCKLCSIRQYWEVLCASFIIRNSTWEMFCVSFVVQRTRLQ